MPLIVLHVGAFKTGTSFIQHTLAANREALASDGVLYPGRGPGSHFSAVRDLTRSGRSRAPRDPGWSELLHECTTWPGELAILSAENMSLLRDAAVGRLLRGLGGHRVRVVYGARDIVRAVPSQWQSYIRNSDGNAPTYSEYLRAVMSADATSASRSYWQTHDWPSVLREWGSHLDRSDLTVLPVPPSGADESRLWLRFGAAAGFDASRYPLAQMRNSSLGAESAEVVRHVSLAMAAQQPATADRVARNRALRAFSRRALAQHRSQERRVIFPPDAGEWALRRTKELRAQVDAIGVQVQGSMDDLTPRLPTSVPDGATTSPDSLPDAQILDAALAGLTRWGRLGQAESIRASSAGAPDQLSRAVTEIARLLDTRAARRAG